MNTHERIAEPLVLTISETAADEWGRAFGMSGT